MRGGLGRPLRRGDRRAERGDAAGRDRGRAHHRRPEAELLDGLTLVDVLERTGLAKSRKEARRTVKEGGSYVNNVQQTDDGRTFASATSCTTGISCCARASDEVHIVKAV